MDMAQPGAPSTGINELLRFLVQAAKERAFGEVRFNLQEGRIGIVKFDQHFKPGELDRHTTRLERTFGQ